MENVRTYPQIATQDIAQRQHRVLRNTYALLALSMAPTVAGALIGIISDRVGRARMIMLVWTIPRVMAIVLLMLIVVVLPALWIGRRVRRLSRASQDRVADSSAIAAEILNAVPVVQSYVAEERESRRFSQATHIPMRIRNSTPGSNLR